ncbi:NHX3 [Symbiodinium sp. CCMP2592]|nr:NHX3 [Symbiodinium sp. CCMP2592]
MVRVGYSDDDVWHERVVLLPGKTENCYWIVTPDLDVYEEDLGGNATDGPEKEVTNDFVEEKILEAWREHEATHGEVPDVEGEMIVLPDGSSRLLSGLVPRRRLRLKSGAGKLHVGAASHSTGSRPVDKSVIEEDFETWVVVYHAQGDRLGEQIKPPLDTAVVPAGGQAFKLFPQDGGIFFFQGCAAADAPAIGVVRRPAADERAERDIRVLPVLFDAAEERWRSLEEALAEFEEVDFEDFP